MDDSQSQTCQDAQNCQNARPMKFAMKNCELGAIFLHWRSHHFENSDNFEIAWHGRGSLRCVCSGGCRTNSPVHEFAVLSCCWPVLWGMSVTGLRSVGDLDVSGVACLVAGFVTCERWNRPTDETGIIPPCVTGKHPLVFLDRNPNLQDATTGAYCHVDCKRTTPPPPSTQTTFI